MNVCDSVNVHLLDKLQHAALCLSDGDYGDEECGRDLAEFQTTNHVRKSSLVFNSCLFQNLIVCVVIFLSLFSFCCFVLPQLWLSWFYLSHCSSSRCFQFCFLWKPLPLCFLFLFSTFYSASSLEKKSQSSLMLIITIGLSHFIHNGFMCRGQSQIKDQ